MLPNKLVEYSLDRCRDTIGSRTSSIKRQPQIAVALDYEVSPPKTEDV